MASLPLKETKSDIDKESSYFTENNPAYLLVKEGNHQNVNKINTYCEVNHFSMEEEPRRSQRADSSQENKAWGKTKRCIVIASVLAIVVLVVVLLVVVLVFGVKTLAGKSNTQHLSIEQELASFEMQLQKLNTSLHRLESQIAHFPAFSCAALPPSSPSGYYWVRASNGSAVRVYCDMTRSCGGVTGGWTRVFELDMTNSSQQCPSGLRQRNDNDLRTCGISISSGSGGCSQSILPTNRLQYSRVCGRIKAYQVGSPDTFGHAVERYGGGTIDSYYVDGVSLTHGNPRQHIWTFAAGLDEVGSYPDLSCVCTNSNYSSMAAISPPFVGNDYFCDTGSSDMFQKGLFYSSDPLWDGAGCGPLNTCCSFNTPPWFYKQLPQPTTDDIEMRMCRNEHTDDNEDTPIEMMEIYVQ